MGFMRANRSVGLTVLGLSLVYMLALSARGEDAVKRVGIVDVSRVFQEYQKVKDVENNMQKKYDPDKKTLEKEEGDLRAREDELKIVQDTQSKDRNYILKVQKFQLDKFDFDSKVAALEAKVGKEKTEEMKKVLNEIKAAIRFIGAEEKLDLVLRAPDFDTEFDPSRNDRERDEPKSASELVRRFRENPVLYYNQTIEITKKVFEKLNGDYKPAAAPVAPK